MTDSEKYLVMNAVKDAQERFLYHARYSVNQLETELYRRIYIAMYNLLKSLELEEEYEDWEWGDETDEQEQHILT